MGATVPGVKELGIIPQEIINEPRKDRTCDPQIKSGLRAMLNKINI
jgi:hypothetical protein